MKKLLAVVLSSLILLAACAATPTDTAPAESPSAGAERTEAVTADSAYEEGIAPSSIDATASAPQEKMIERWFLHMETETFEESFEKLQDSIEKYNAYLDGADIHNRAIYDQQRHRTAMLTIRVNAEDTNKLLQEYPTTAVSSRCRFHSERGLKTPSPIPSSALSCFWKICCLQPFAHSPICSCSYCWELSLPSFGAKIKTVSDSTDRTKRM